MTALARRQLLVAACVGVAGCLGDTENGDDTQPALDDDDTRERSVPTTQRNLPLPADPGTLVDGMQRGAGQDAIPAIDEPVFMDARTADDQIPQSELVFGFEHNGVARAYPQRILVWHEIVNDEIGGDGIAVTYCPLTGTAQAFRRDAVEFGVSGLLLNSNLIMYDRLTESLWPQMLAAGISGPHMGEELMEYQLTWTDWGHWRSVFPESEILTEETGYARDYQNDPYGSYDPPSGHYANESLLFPPFGDGSPHEFHPKEVVIGARSVDGAVAVNKDTLAEERVLTGQIGGISHAAVYDERLNTGWIYRNPDGLSLEATDEAVVIEDNRYDPDELPLTSIVRYDAMWFAWEGYYPETAVLS